MLPETKAATLLRQTKAKAGKDSSMTYPEDSDRRGFAVGEDDNPPLPTGVYAFIPHPGLARAALHLSARPFIATHDANTL